MDLRTHLQQQISKIDIDKSLLLELPTGIGKTFLSLKRIEQYKQYYGITPKILVVVPKLVLIKNWEEEIIKWGYPLVNFTFVTYLSLRKMSPIYEMVIFDEAHHITENNFAFAKLISSNATSTVFLSASISVEKRKLIMRVNRGIETIQISTKEAIDRKALPDPKVLVVPMFLENINKSIECKTKDGKVFKQTPLEYYQYLSRCVERNKNLYMNGQSNKKKTWLYMAGLRLKFLAKQKTDMLKDLYPSLKDRSITFCADIQQAQDLNIPSVVSKNKKASEVYTKFNTGEINHISCVGILDEGVNVKDCKIGIYAYIASTDRLIIQRLGRLLRHPNPVLIIPFFIDTREQENLAKMLVNYNKKLVKTVSYKDVLKYI